MITLQMVLTSTSCLAAQQESPIFDFVLLQSGRYPVAPLIGGKGGILYGTTSSPPTEHSRRSGTVFSLAPPSGGGTAWTEQTLFTFTGGGNGSSPLGGLTFGPAGVLYGTTSEGGSDVGGTVFELQPPSDGGTAWTQTILSQVSGSPVAGLIRGSDGTLYGTTVDAPNGSLGTVFSVTPPTGGGSSWTTTTLYSFQGGADGSAPAAPVVQQANTGILYGTTSTGGNGSGAICASSGCGTVFQLTPPSGGQTQWTESVIYAFQGGNDGSTPLCGLTMDSSGVLYGTTMQGGPHGEGTVFKLTPPGNGQSAWTETVLYAFDGTLKDGNQPYAGVVLDSDGALFGTTKYGGRHFDGTAFKLVPPTSGQGPWTETILHHFWGHGDGHNPAAPLIIGKSSTLFGTTERGGSGGGTAFEILR